MSAHYSLLEVYQEGTRYLYCLISTKQKHAGRYTLERQVKKKTANRNVESKQHFNSLCFGTYYEMIMSSYVNAATTQARKINIYLVNVSQT